MSWRRGCRSPYPLHCVSLQQADTFRKLRVGQILEWIICCSLLLNSLAFLPFLISSPAAFLLRLSVQSWFCPYRAQISAMTSSQNIHVYPLCCIPRITPTKSAMYGFGIGLYSPSTISLSPHHLYTAQGASKLCTQVDLTSLRTLRTRLFWSDADNEAGTPIRRRSGAFASPSSSLSCCVCCVGGRRYCCVCCVG